MAITKWIEITKESVLEDARRSGRFDGLNDRKNGKTRKRFLVTRVDDSLWMAEYKRGYLLGVLSSPRAVTHGN